MSRENKSDELITDVYRAKLVYEAEMKSPEYQAKGEEDFEFIGKALAAKGYCKASEIFEEIEKEIELALDSNYRAKKEHYNHSVIPNYDNFKAMCDGKIYAMRGLLDFMEELKKKYNGEDTNVPTKESEKV